MSEQPSAERAAQLRAQLAEHLRFLQELGVQGFSRDPRWSSRPGPSRAARRVTNIGPQGAADGPPMPAQEGGPHGGAARRQARGAVSVSNGEALREIRVDLGDCTRCKLHRLGRRQIVFGVGNPDADLMFVGEAPGHDEDVQGEPFVGRAGQLLTRIIEAIGLRREDVYIANVIKCRPPENRNPEPDEVDMCEPFLFRQVETIRPKVIVALGTFAARTLLKTQDPISRLRGRIYTYGHAKLIPTFHPAFLLRSPDRKRDVWEDMKKVRAILNEESSE
jgi:DNA polymerase